MPGIDQAVPVEAPVEAAPEQAPQESAQKATLQATSVLTSLAVAQKEQGNARLFELMRPVVEEVQAISQGGQAPQAGAPPVAPPEAEVAPRIERDPNAARGSVPI